MTTLITGGTGFVGKRIIKSLGDEHGKVIVTSRNISRAQKTLGSDVEVVEWNTPATQPLEIPEGRSVETVINLMGDPIDKGRWNSTKKNSIRTSRVDATTNLIAGLAKLKEKPKVLVSASAVGFYGTQGDTVLAEDAEMGTGFLPEVCHEWEQAARLAENMGIRVVLVRIGIVLGTEGGAYPLMSNVFRWGIGGRLGNGKHWFPWIHVEDLAGMMIWATGQQNVTGPLNAAAPGVVTNAEFTKELVKSLGRWAPFPAPYFAVRAAAGEFADCLFFSQRVKPAKAIECGYSFRFPEIAGALENLRDESKR